MSNNQEEYNRGGLYAFLFSMVFVFSFMFYFSVIHPGIDLAENVVDPTQQGPGQQTEQFDIQKVAEPWIETPDMIAHGKKLYNTNCSMCHGNEGRGDGPAGMGLNPRPRDLVEGQWAQGNGLIAKFNVITKGIPGTSMAAYAHLKPADRWAMAHFVQSITSNKGSDDPAKVAEFGKTAQ